jgi:hypothetical protein
MVGLLVAAPKCTVAIPTPKINPEMSGEWRIDLLLSNSFLSGKALATRIGVKSNYTSRKQFICDFYSNFFKLFV